MNCICAYLKKNKIIGKCINGKYKLPWKYIPEDMQFFFDITKNKTVIMGKNTFKSLKLIPLKERKNIVISKSIKKDQEDGKIPYYSSKDIYFVDSFDNIDSLLLKEEKNIFFIGGNEIYKEGIKLSDNLYITEIYESKEEFIKKEEKYIHFPEIPKEFKNPIILNECLSTSGYFLKFKKYQRYYDEHQYLDLIKKIISNGVIKENTKSIFGYQMKFSLEDNKIPLLTTKKMFWRGIVEELLWFLRGETNSKILEKKGVNIWKENSTTEFLRKRGLNYPEGEIGPGYGHQWRNWAGKHDQIKNLIDGIKKNPFSRRHIINSWNVSDLELMALPPCHILCQFYVSPDNRLSCHLYQRSGDVGLGIPFNVASYSLLTYIIAKECNLIPGEFIHSIGDAHIYLEHIEALEKQIKLSPFNPPKLFISEKKKFDKYQYSDFILYNYKHSNKIKMKFI